MVDILTQHDTKWVSPSPMWADFSDTSTSKGRKDFNRPTILRFNTDSFMDELLSVMNYYPETLSEWKAQPETWREPMATPATAAKIQIAQPLSQFKKVQTRQIKDINPLGSSRFSVSQAEGSVAEVAADEENKLPLKLYQPAQLRFYLVTASFVCRKVGLPDRKVDLAKQQKVRFVLRRLLPKDLTQPVDPEKCDIDECDEYAFLLTDEGKQWTKVGDGASIGNATLLEDEERLPMFNVGYEETADKKRRMLAGYIPVAQRETYLNAEISEVGFDDGDVSVVLSSAERAELKAAVALDKKRDAIAHLFNLQIAGPWKRLISQAINEGSKSDDWSSNPPPIVDDLGAPPANDASAVSNLKDSREKIQTTSWYILVDFVKFLKDYVPNVYSFIENSVEPVNISDEETELYEALAEVTLNHANYQSEFIENHFNYLDDAYHSDNELYSSLISALKHLIDNPSIATELDLVDYPFDRDTENFDKDHVWPSFLFPLADPLHDAPIPNLSISPENQSDSEPDISHDQLDALMALVREAIPSDLQRSAPDVDAPKAPKQSNAIGWFTIRCVFESPNCGPIHPAIVSESTEAFQMASFFDPDAPGRPIKIPMPLDISPAGLRKFNKNATFMISDMLCGKIRGIRKTTLGDLVLSVLPWPFHKDLPDPGKTGPCAKSGTSFGMFCSLSIPIVTLCAMILLIIMVTLFDIFFRWLPLLFVCLPIPGLKGKIG